MAPASASGARSAAFRFGGAFRRRSRGSASPGLRVMAAVKVLLEKRPELFPLVRGKSPGVPDSAHRIAVHFPLPWLCRSFPARASMPFHPTVKQVLQYHQDGPACSGSLRRAGVLNCVILLHADRRKRLVTEAKPSRNPESLRKDRSRATRRRMSSKKIRCARSAARSTYRAPVTETASARYRQPLH